DCPGLRLRGLLAYDGHIYDLAGAAAVAQAARKAYDTLSEVAGRMRSGNMPVKCVSVGATAGARVAADHPAVTELRAGSYIFNDRCQIVMGWAAEHQCALTVLATVVSVSAPDRAVIDAGSKALTFAPVPGVRGYGLIKGH